MSVHSISNGMRCVTARLMLLMAVGASDALATEIVTQNKSMQAFEVSKFAISNNWCCAEVRQTINQIGSRIGSLKIVSLGAANQSKRWHFGLGFNQNNANPGLRGTSGTGRALNRTSFL